MKLRMLAALVTFSLFMPLSPAWAQKGDLPGLEGFWYSCANHEENLDLIPETHKALFSKEGKFHSEKYHVEGNQIKFAGRTLVMTDGELDEGSTHWVNGISLLKTNCPGAVAQSPAAATANGAATSQQQVQPEAPGQPEQTTQPEQTAQAPQAPPLTETVPATAQTGRKTADNATSSVDLASLQQTANAGDAAVQAELGSRYLNGKGAPQDYALGLAWSRKAANQGNARGQYLVGLCSEKGWATNKDEKEAMQWWQKAADQGNAEAEFDLGSYWIAKGLKGSAADWVPYADIFSGIKEGKEIGRGQKLIQAAAEQGHMAAEIHVGHAALRHHHYEEAVSWFKKASDQGDPAADISLGDLYYNGGKHFPKDPTQSADWYRKAAEKNSPAGEDKLGNLYRDGIGVAKDKTQALSWYDKAATKYQQMGDTALQATRAEEETKTAKYFYGKAAEVMKKEAELGDSKADRALGKMYQQGLGVQQDKQQAANWYAKAVADGNTDANTDLAAVKQEIAKDQVAQAGQAQEQAKSKASDRRSWIALAGLAGASIANAQGADAATVLKTGLSAAAIASKVTSDKGGQDQTTTALMSLAQAANGQATNPIQQTANEQIAAIHALADAKTPQERADVQQRLAAQQAFKQAAALAQGTGDKFNCVGASGADNGYNNGCQLVPGTNSSANGNSGGGTGDSTAGNSSSGAVTTDGGSIFSANTSNAGGSSSPAPGLGSSPTPGETYNPNRHYSGPGAAMVDSLLAKSPGWSCPTSSAASFTFMPPLERVCMRDSYVLAAVTEAYGAECEARLGRDKEAAADAKAMMENVANAKKMCSHALAIGGGSSCTTLDLVPCD